MQQSQEFEPTEEDKDAFFKANPQLQAALKTFTLLRLLRERDAEIARLKDGKPAMAPITPMPETKEG